MTLDWNLIFTAAVHREAVSWIRSKPMTPSARADIVIFLGQAGSPVGDTGSPSAVNRYMYICVVTALIVRGLSVVLGFSINVPYLSRSWSE